MAMAVVVVVAVVAAAIRRRVVGLILTARSRVGRRRGSRSSAATPRRAQSRLERRPQRTCVVLADRALVLGGAYDIPSVLGDRTRFSEVHLGEREADGTMT